MSTMAYGMPPSLQLSYVLTHDFSMAGEMWSKRRKLFNQHFSPAVIHKYEDLQLQSTHRMLLSLLISPDHFEEHVRW